MFDLFLSRVSHAMYAFPELEPAYMAEYLPVLEHLLDTLSIGPLDFRIRDGILHLKERLNRVATQH